jgi:hypothetical protein
MLYRESVYTVTPADDGGEENLLKELISQRLAQGYQLIDTYAFETTGTVTPLSSNMSKRRMTFFSSVPHYLSMGHHVHRLVYDYNLRNVEVKRYTKNIHYSMEPIDYRCYVWAKSRDSYEPRSVSFRYPYLSTYNWNYLDNFIAGHEEEMTDALRFWRTRFILIPIQDVTAFKATLGSGTDTLNEEEIKIAGFTKFLEVVEKVRVTQMRPKHPIDSLGIVLTPLNTADYVHEERNKYQSGHTTDVDPLSESIHEPKWTRNSPIADIVDTLFSPTEGIKFKDRFWDKQYDNSFIGHQLVDWLLLNLGDLRSRDEATEYAEDVLRVEHEVFEHCSKRHRFLDGHYFYRLTPDFQKLCADKQQGKRTKPSTFAFLKKLVGTLEETEVEMEVEPRAPLSITLSRRISINIDPSRKSDRKEIAVLHYDVIHNINHVYHLHLNWLNTTARLIEDLLQSWSRTAERCGLRLVEAPVEQAQLERNDNPFHTPVEIYLSVRPPTIDELVGLGIPGSVALSHARQFQERLASRFGFILDVESDLRFPPDVQLDYSHHKTEYTYNQYIHRSGCAFLQIHEPSMNDHADGWILFSLNRLLTTHMHPTMKQSGMGFGTSGVVDPNVLLRQIQEFCGNRQPL